MKVCWLCVEGKCGYAGYCLFQNKDKICIAKEENLEEFNPRTSACRPINGEIYVFTEKELQRFCQKVFAATEAFGELQTFLRDLYSWKVLHPLMDSQKRKEVS